MLALHTLHTLHSTEPPLASAIQRSRPRSCPRDGARSRPGPPTEPRLVQRGGEDTVLDQPAKAAAGGQADRPGVYGCVLTWGDRNNQTKTQPLEGLSIQNPTSLVKSLKARSLKARTSQLAPPSAGSPEKGRGKSGLSGCDSGPWRERRQARPTDGPNCIRWGSGKKAELHFGGKRKLRLSGQQRPPIRVREPLDPGQNKRSMRFRPYARERAGAWYMLRNLLFFTSSVQEP